jgi:hypothetical protein
VPVYRLRLEKIIWKVGDGETVKADVIKQRSYKNQAPRPNLFFRSLYSRDFSKVKRLRGEDHTGQLAPTSASSGKTCSAKGKSAPCSVRRRWNWVSTSAA